jgi:MYXO-CTERM domain-containing protein
MVEQCDTDCQTTGGAIFCDGQFLNVTNVNDCAAQLAAEINVNVDVQVAARARVSTTTTTPSDSKKTTAFFDCAVVPSGVPGSRGAGSSGLIALGAIAALGAMRRRRNLF